MSLYGHFNDKNEFLISNPKTPEPWIHYLIRPDQPNTETFCSGVTHSCGGFDVRGTHENTILDTQVHLNDGDDLGRYIYIKDVDKNELFTTTWQPIRPEGQEFETTFKFGSIQFESRFNGLETMQNMIVPLEFDGWIQNIKIRNTLKTRRHLEIYPFVPIHMGDALVRLLAGDNDAFFGGASLDKDLKGIVFRRNHGIPVKDDPVKINGMLGNVVLYYSSLNDEKTSYETNLEDFFGDRFHNQKNPLSIANSCLKSSDTAHLRRACGVFKHEIELDPGEEIEFSVSLIAGSTYDYYQNDKKELRRIIQLLDSADARKKMFSDVSLWWTKRLNQLKLESPSEKINRAFPWLQYQCEIVLVLNRMKSRYHTGYEYGWGFRDILQDILYLLPYRPEEMGLILEHVSRQIFSTGQVYHNFFIDQPGNKEIEASDDPLWFVQAVVQWCKETGSFSILDKITPYAEAKEEKIDKKGTILEHCVACLDRVLGSLSKRGLPFMKDCDWNDDLNELRKENRPSQEMESVMVGQQLYGVLKDFEGLLKHFTGHDLCNEHYKEKSAKLLQSLYNYAFDKEGYFKRALSCNTLLDDLGSSDNFEGKIFLESQVFGINNGVVDQQKGESILSSVEKYLDTPWGAMLCFPFYQGLSQRNQLPERSWNIEKEPPGMKENGGIFMHLNAWLVESYCRSGMGKKALELYLKTLPENMSQDQDRYMAEPYVYPEYVRGAGVEHFGRGGHSWLTGTAPTMHRALTEFIFGIRSEYDGLKIDPCLDPSWKVIKIKRLFRGAVYSIKIENPAGVEQGINSVFVDGKEIQGNIVKSFSDGKEHQVHVIMGM